MGRPQIGAQEIGQLVRPRPGHVGDEAGGRSERELREPIRHLSGIDGLEPPAGRPMAIGSLAICMTVVRIPS